MGGSILSEEWSDDDVKGGLAEVTTADGSAEADIGEAALLYDPLLP